MPTGKTTGTHFNPQSRNIIWYSHTASVVSVSTLRLSMQHNNFLFCLFRILHFIAMILCAKCHILRLPCGTRYADFIIYYKDARLNGPVMQTITGVDDIQCMVHCVEYPFCRSYAINSAFKTCSLFDRRLGDNEKTALISETGWIYKTTDFKATLVCFQIFWHNKLSLSST